MNRSAVKIVKFIKNSLYPSFQNSFHPYILRAPALISLAVLLVGLQLAVNVNGPSENILGVTHSVESQKLASLTNAEREKAGVEELELNANLQAAAQAKARDMVERNYWDHFAPDGTSPWSFIQENGYKYSFAGENLAKGFQTSEGVVKGWMNSPGHRQNMLDSRFSEVGFATSKGKIEGRNTTVVVAMYGSPRPLQYGFIQIPSEGGDTLPAKAAYSLLRPLASVSIVPLATRVAVLVSFALASVYALQHLVIRNRQLVIDEHVHPRPLLQSSVLIGLAVLLLQSGFGAVG